MINRSGSLVICLCLFSELTKVLLTLLTVFLTMFTKLITVFWYNLFTRIRIQHLSGSLCLLFFYVNSSFAQDLGNLQDQKPVIFHGNFNANIIGYHASGIENRQQPFSYVFSANINASFYGIELPFSFTYSNRQKEFSQPFNRFGISPHYKWLTLHGGYRNISFSNFTLASHTVLGAGIEMNPGKFRFGFIAGRFNRSTEGNSYEKIDSLPYYKRNGMALKLGVGSSRTFIDLIVLKVKDETASLPFDSIFPERTPEENLVTGLNTRIAFSKQLYFEGEGALSIFTGNQYAPGFDGADAGKIEKYSSFILINQSSCYYTAGKAAMIYKLPNISFRLDYKRIDPGYKSLGAYFFNNDVQSIAIGPAFSLMKKKLMLRGNIGFQNDNLRKTKKSTSKRTVGSLNISYNPSQVFGMDASYSNFSTNQRAGRIPLVDTLKVFQSTSNFSLMPRLTILKPTINHIIILTFNRTNLNDKNPVTESVTENKVSMVNLVYTLSLPAKKLAINTGLNFMSLKNYMSDNTARGITAGVSAMVAKGMMMLGWTNTFLVTEYIGNKGHIFTTALNMSYKLKKNHLFRINTYYTGNYYPEGSVMPSYNELKGDIGYVYTF